MRGDLQGLMVVLIENWICFVRTSDLQEVVQRLWEGP